MKRYVEVKDDPIIIMATHYGTPSLTLQDIIKQEIPDLRDKISKYLEDNDCYWDKSVADEGADAIIALLEGSKG